MKLPETNQYDPYTYKGTQVLVNRFEIRDPEKAKAIESRLSTFRGDTVEKEFPVGGPYDLARLQRHHAHRFQDVFEWAGQLRTLNLSKGKSVFADFADIPIQGKLIFSKLKNDNELKGLEKPGFVQKFTELYADLNALHPFREGNGRATRDFADNLARSAGYDLSLAGVGKDEWNAASSRSTLGDLDGLKSIFEKAIRPVRALAFEQMERSEALVRYPELKGSFELHDVMVKKASASFPNNLLAKTRFSVQATEHVLSLLNAGKVVASRLDVPAVKVASVDQQRVGFKAPSFRR